MALSAGLSILMTVFVFPYLHKRLPEHVFLRLCKQYTTREDNIRAELRIRLDVVSRRRPLLPLRLVPQLHL